MGTCATRHSFDTATDTPAAWLAAVARHRDKAAFASLFAHYAPRLKGWLMAGGLSNDLAEDIIQETLLAVWHHASQFDGRKAHVGTWIFTIARNKKLDVLRRKNAHETALSPTMLTLTMEAQQVFSHTPHVPLEVLLSDAEHRQLHQALKNLPANQFELLYEMFFTGKTQQQLADEQGIPLGTIKSRMRLAYARLREAMQIDAP